MRYFIVSLLIPFFCLSQSLSFKSKKINLLFNDSVVLPNTKYLVGTDGTSIAFSQIKFYISDLSGYKQGVKTYVAPKRYHLVDFVASNSLYLEFDCDACDTIGFNIGVDRATNLEGVKADDLDPLKGMYWTWNTGYINIKIEALLYDSTGKVKSLKYHIGGFESPFDTTQHVSTDHSLESSIDIHLDQFFQLIDVSSMPMVLSPGDSAFALAGFFKSVIN